jgi:hypothetical protein
MGVRTYPSRNGLNKKETTLAAYKNLLPLIHLIFNTCYIIQYICYDWLGNIKSYDKGTGWCGMNWITVFCLRIGASGRLL